MQFRRSCCVRHPPTSPRMLSRLRKFLRMRIYSISKTATAGPGADSALVTSRAASQARSQRPALLQAAAETGKEEYCLSSFSLERGSNSSARMETRWSSHHPVCSIRYQFPHVSSSANEFFLRAPARIALTVHTFRRQMSTMLIGGTTLRYHGNASRRPFAPLFDVTVLVSPATLTIMAAAAAPSGRAL